MPQCGCGWLSESTRIPVRNQPPLPSGSAAVFTLQPAACEALAELLGRIAQVAHRHPAAADRLLDRLSVNAFTAGDTAVGVDALYARFGLLEPRGRANIV